MTNSNDAFLDKKFNSLFNLQCDSEELLTKSEKESYERLARYALETMEQIKECMSIDAALQRSNWSLGGKREILYSMFFIVWGLIPFVTQSFTDNYTLFLLAAYVLTVFTPLFLSQSISNDIQANNCERISIKSNRYIFGRDLKASGVNGWVIYIVTRYFEDYSEKEYRKERIPVSFFAYLKALYFKILTKNDYTKLADEQRSRHFRISAIYDCQLRLAIIQSISSNPKFHNESFKEAMEVVEF